MSEQFLKKTMKKWDKEANKGDLQEDKESRIEKEYLERKKELAKQLEIDMKSFKKELGSS
ncbi:MAG: hypothetical protein ACXACU_05955 [Candidatus Hodarchaeales archaeon]|jgi:hypothetical protein